MAKVEMTIMGVMVEMEVAAKSSTKLAAPTV